MKRVLTAKPRTKQLKVLLSEDELDRLRALATEEGVSVSHFVRRYIRDCWKRRWPQSTRLGEL